MSRHWGRNLRKVTLVMGMAGAITAVAVRSLGATDRDLPALPDTSFSVRVFQAAGTVCSIETARGVTRFGIRALRGAFSGGLSPSDSVMVYDSSTRDWKTARLAGFWMEGAAWAAAPLGGGTPSCNLGDSSAMEQRPQASLELDAPRSVLGRIEVGAPVRAFRSIEYGVFQWAGDWWLGRRMGGARDWDLLTGPLFPPGPGGIEIAYYNTDGTIATKGSEVATVELLLWINDRPLHRDPSSQGRPPGDHMRIRVHLRDKSTW